MQTSSSLFNYDAPGKLIGRTASECTSVMQRDAGLAKQGARKCQNILILQSDVRQMTPTTTFNIHFIITQQLPLCCNLQGTCFSLILSPDTPSPDVMLVSLLLGQIAKEAVRPFLTTFFSCRLIKVRHGRRMSSHPMVQERKGGSYPGSYLLSNL